MMNPLQDALNRWSESELRYNRRTSEIKDAVIERMVDEALEIPEEPIHDTEYTHKTRKERITHITNFLNGNGYKEWVTSQYKDRPLVNKRITMTQHIKNEAQVVECDTARGKELLVYIPAPAPDDVQYIRRTVSMVYREGKLVKREESDEWIL